MMKGHWIINSNFSICEIKNNKEIYLIKSDKKVYRDFKEIYENNKGENIITTASVKASSFDFELKFSNGLILIKSSKFSEPETWYKLKNFSESNLMKFLSTVSVSDGKVLTTNLVPVFNNNEECAFVVKDTEDWRICRINEIGELAITSGLKTNWDNITPGTIISLVSEHLRRAAFSASYVYLGKINTDKLVFIPTLALTPDDTTPTKAVINHDIMYIGNFQNDNEITVSQVMGKVLVCHLLDKSRKIFANPSPYEFEDSTDINNNIDEIAKSKIKQTYERHKISMTPLFDNENNIVSNSAYSIINYLALFDINPNAIKDEELKGIIKQAISDSITIHSRVTTCFTQNETLYEIIYHERIPDFHWNIITNDATGSLLTTRGKTTLDELAKDINVQEILNTSQRILTTKVTSIPDMANRELFEKNENPNFIRFCDIRDRSYKYLSVIPEDKPLHKFLTEVFLPQAEPENYYHYELVNNITDRISVRSLNQLSQLKTHYIKAIITYRNIYDYFKGEVPQEIVDDMIKHKFYQLNISFTKND